MTRRTISSIDSSTISFLPLVSVMTVSGVSSIVSMISAFRTNSPFWFVCELNLVSFIIRFDLPSSLSPVFSLDIPVSILFVFVTRTGFSFFFSRKFPLFQKKLGRNAITVPLPESLPRGFLQKLLFHIDQRLEHLVADRDHLGVRLEAAS